MATVVPATFPDDHSGAERGIYDALRDETSSDWRALHSVGLAVHDRKPWAEVDFVVITDRVVICLEVKGGRITVEDGTWFTNGERLTHSPFEQAGGGCGALKGYLRKRLGGDAPLVGWAVAFPATTFEVDAPWAHPELLYDERDMGTPIGVFLDQVAIHWMKRVPETESLPRLDEARAEVLLEMLAPDFCLVPTLRARVEGLRKEFDRLTGEQIEVMNGFSDQSRLLVSGGAGSGKTTLALAEADRLAAENRSVFLCCASAPLARDLQWAMRSAEKVKTESAIQLATRMITKAGLHERIPDAAERDVVAIHMPQLAAEAFDLLDYERFDALVIDEGQDLIQGNWLDFFDRVVDRGLDDGLWRVFHDPNQDLLLGTNPQSLDDLESRADSRYRLQKNCRNTRQVATTAAQVSGIPSLDRMCVDGPDVELQWYRGGEGQRAQAVAIVREWLSGGMDPDEITILASSPLGQTALAGADSSELGAPISDDLDLSREDAGHTIKFATIENFKGLESRAVLVIGVDDLAAGAARLAMYVAMTRAESLLALLLDADVESTYQELVRDFAERTKAGLIPIR